MKRKPLNGIDLVIAFTVAAIVSYYIARVIFLVWGTYTLPAFLLSAMVFMAETFLIIHTLGFLIGSFRLAGEHPVPIPKVEVTDWPPVAVVLPVKNEPADVLEQTLITVTGLDYPSFNIYFLDDSDNPPYVAQNQDLVKKYAVNYFRPNNLRTAKAGAINEFLSTMEEKYLAIFDADQNPMPSFLKETVSIAEADANIAFVQTPQFYANIGVSPIAKAAAMQQSIFFEGICEAKAQVNAMFCCGTNVLLRKEALQKVGGFDQHSVTEDFSTSIKLHMAGYTSVYLNNVQVFGAAPETLTAYFKQQTRWSSGTGQIFLTLVKNFFANRQCLTMAQWFEYFLSSSFYFVGWAFLLLMACPIIWLFFGVSAYVVTTDIYMLTFIPYYLFTTAFLYVVMRKRNYTLQEIYFGSILGFLSFPILIASSIKGLFNKKMKFVVTPKGKQATMSLWELWPWHVAIVANLAAIIAGGFIIRGQSVAVLINVLWCSYHVFLLSYIYVFNQKPKRAEVIA